MKQTSGVACAAGGSLFGVLGVLVGWATEEAIAIS